MLHFHLSGHMRLILPDYTCLGYNVGCRPNNLISVKWWGRVAAHCCFNAGQLCTTLGQQHSNTDRTHDSSTPASTVITRRLTNVASMLIQRVLRWPNNNPEFGIAYTGYFAVIAMGVTISSPVVRKATTQIYWPKLWNNVGPLSATLSQQYSN